MYIQRTLIFCSGRLQRWKRDKALSFVPPDGKFTLMEYRYLPPTSKSLSAPSAQVQVPFSLKPTVATEEDAGMPNRDRRLHSTNKQISGSFNVSLTSRLSTRLFDEVVVEFYLGDGSSGVNCTASHGTSWSFDSRTFKVRWDLKNIPPSGTHSLRGSWASRSEPFLRSSLTSCSLIKRRIVKNIPDLRRHSGYSMTSRNTATPR